MLSIGECVLAGNERISVSDISIASSGCDTVMSLLFPFPCFTRRARQALSICSGSLGTHCLSTFNRTLLKVSTHLWLRTLNECPKARKSLA